MKRRMKRHIIHYLGILFWGCLAGCSGTSSRVEMDTHTASSETDSTNISTETVEDTGTGSDTVVLDTDTGSVLGKLGERCWIEQFPSGHPNLGMSDCESALTCIGDKDEGWCSDSCNVTGTVTDRDAIDGWCCGELGSACNPSRLWMPNTMSAECAPREIPQGESCDPNGNSRCKPLCIGSEIEFHTACTATDEGHICSHACERHLDCIDYPVFSEGCCASLMGATYCQPFITDACISDS